MDNNVHNPLANELLEIQRTLGWMDLVIGSISDAVYVTDSDSRLVFVNQYFSDLLEIPRVFLLGKHLSEVFDVTLDTISTKELSADSLPDDKAAGVYRWVNADKNYTFKISKRLIPTTNQTVYLAQDITREQELSDMKNGFINLASHQLRTPMTSIMLHAHMLNDLHTQEDNPKQKELTHGIVRASERMIRLINDILNITKIQNDISAAFQPEEIVLKDIVAVLNDEISPGLSVKEIEFSTALPKSLPTFLCSRTALHEILSNLLVNAVQYTPHGGKISLRARATPEVITISVKDNGIGIPGDALPYVFDQFSRASNAFEMFNEGTGLGLYLVKLLLVRIGGSITCKSTLNKGATFTVTIPMIAA